MSILHFYFILTINQQLLTLFCERVATYDSHSVRSHVRTHTAYQKYSCERASEQEPCRKRHHKFYYRIRLVCRCRWCHMKSSVHHSFPCRSIFGALYSLRWPFMRYTRSYTHSDCSRIFGHRISWYRSSSSSTFTCERTNEVKKCQFLIYVLRTSIWVNKGKTHQQHQHTQTK